MNLIIVESPTKAKTIQRFLPADFVVRSSYGHIRDLPAKKLGIDVENNFEPQYVVSLVARKKLADIKKLLPKTNKIILATDEDREGEAIAWHLTHALKIDEKETDRIVFHEITKKAIETALNTPRKIDMDLVDAQQARRVLDRLVGYELSPFLWRKVAKGLSAGRVQSVAVRLVVEKEREIEKFKPEEYWSIEALLKKLKTGEEFSCTLIKQNGVLLPKIGIKNEDEAKKITKDLKNSQYSIKEISKKEVKRYPAPPFITSSLQQEAVNKLKFSAKQAMQIAQQLYEGVEIENEGSVGLITYMRTDSFNLAQEAIAQIRGYISEKFGEKYLPASPKVYKSRKSAQEAHEAIRPTDISREPDEIKKFLTPQQYKLYNLIWKRAMASQMEAAILDTISIDVDAKNGKNNYILRANGSRIKFEGFLKVYNGKIQETILPELEEGEKLDLVKLTPSQHFTQPPARYNEASLIKALEEDGIGRPSTYAPIISTILDRNYVQKDENKRFFPTEIGIVVTDLLTEHFPQIVDLKFTAHIEKDLDNIAEGKQKWVPVMKEFYGPFKENLNKKYTEVEKKKAEPEKTDRTCPKCGGQLLIRTSRFGKFYACSKFPECRFTESLSQQTGVTCPKCIEGKLIEKRTKRGKIFYACSRYPECDFALWNKPTGEKCPHCNSLIVETKKGTECSNKECKKGKEE